MPQFKFRKGVYWVVMIFIGGSLAAFLVEIGAMVVTTSRYGAFYSATELFNRQANENTFIDQITEGENCRYIDTLFPHPYLGFVHHANPPCGMSYINNIGLFGEDFPSEKRKDRFVVLLTGGSVAAQFAQLSPPPCS